MSEPASQPVSVPVSVLNHARFDGLALVQETGLQGMITLRGDLSDKALKAGATKAGGAKMPSLGMANVSDDTGLCWMSPDELLVLCPYTEVSNRLATLTDKLAESFALAVNVSDARAMFRVSGPAAREVLAKLCPVDMSPEAFKPGMFRRTRMAQVPAAFWMDSDESIRIICFRSAADYVFGLLKAAAASGSGVDYYTAAAQS
jgi:sarcosine oxidase subunit gamma